MTGRARLLAIVGPDGAGKSTLCKTLQTKLKKSGVDARVQDRWDIVGHGRPREYRFIQSSAADLKECIGEMHGVTRSLFLFWINAVAAFERTSTAHADVVLADGYWLKHAAAELVQGCPMVLIQACWQIFPAPDLVLLCDIEPQIAYSRKQGVINSYEVGGAISERKKAFVRHQEKIRQVLLQWGREHHWVTIDVNDSQDNVVDQSLAAIRTAFGINV